MVYVRTVEKKMSNRVKPFPWFVLLSIVSIASHTDPLLIQRLIANRS